MYLDMFSHDIHSTVVIMKILCKHYGMLAAFEIGTISVHFVDFLFMCQMHGRGQLGLMGVVSIPPLLQSVYRTIQVTCTVCILLCLLLALCFRNIVAFLVLGKKVVGIALTNPSLKQASKHQCN